MPLHVNVVTRPPLADCWSVNICSIGMGLIALRPPRAQVPVEGSEIALEFALPASGSPVRARGEVRWRHEDPPADGEAAEVALGVQFRHLDDQARLDLARYLAGHRLRVAVAYASEVDRRLLRESAADPIELHFADTPGQLDEILGRGDVVALVVCCRDERDGLAVVERAGACASLLKDLSPRVVYLGEARPEVLLGLFNAGKVFRTLARPYSQESLRRTLEDACRDHGVRTEQRRIGLELERALRREQARSKDGGPPPLGARVGFDSAAMRAVVELVRRAAPTGVAVLLQGETGTGKEVLARFIHETSDRSEAPFVVQDCGVLSEQLLSSELFGHVRGAFTGAIADHAGLFVLAGGGTILLDEIENTTVEIQAKLLRVIETGQIRPVGGTSERHVKVRLIAASNRDLSEQVRAGRFRADLYYRLNRFPIRVPSLRERRDDILPLARSFLANAVVSFDRNSGGFTAEAEDLLVAADWPGNVRELRSVVERAVLLCGPDERIGPEHLPADLVRPGRKRSALEPASALRERLRETERELVRDALERHRGVVRRAALELGLDPVTLARRARKLGLK